MGADRIGSVGATNTVGDMDRPSRVFLTACAVLFLTSLAS